MLSCNLCPSDSRCSSVVCWVVDLVLRLSVDSVLSSVAVVVGLFVLFVYGLLFDTYCN